MSRNVTTEAHDPRERFGLYRLCDCPTCNGRGQVADITSSFLHADITSSFLHPLIRKCPDCRGEGRVREEVATCESPEAVGVALVTLAREGEWTECPLGLLDRTPECATCGGTGKRSAYAEFGAGFPIDPACVDCKGSGVKPTGTWLISPWLPSARNVRDAARTLGKEGARKRSAR